MSVTDCGSAASSPAPFPPKLHLNSVWFDLFNVSFGSDDLLRHAPSTSDGHFCGSFLFSRHHFPCRSAQFVSPLQDISEHLKIIIAKWCFNEGDQLLLSLCAGAGPACCDSSLCLPVWQCQTFYRCFLNLTHAIIIGRAQEMQIAEDLLKCTLKGLEMSVRKSNYLFTSL